MDTHAIHFHLFNVQLVNRVGWDGAIRLPEPNETGLERNHPDESARGHHRGSYGQDSAGPCEYGRPPEQHSAAGSDEAADLRVHRGVDPNGNPVAAYSNYSANFGNEYTWHCHLLGHEENDMMRPILVAVPPATGPTLTATLSGNGNNKRANLSWTAFPGATCYTVQRATDSAFTCEPGHDSAR